MLKIKQYVKAESLEQAYELNQKKTNRIVGGMLWLKMSTAQIQTAIDLSGLGLDQIEETEDAWKIGCMVSLRDLELHEGLNELSCNMIRESVRSIVGVQFRNLATIGGSIFGRFGFSDVLTCFLALDTEVELYKGGIISLEEFAKMERDNDILVRVIVKKTPGKGSYQSHRNTKTDFPVPKYEPPITAAPTTATFRCAPCATLIAIGAIAAIVPMDVPIDVEIKQHIKNTPGTNSFTGIKCRQRFTTESFPPIAAAAPWNPPAIR